MESSNIKIAKKSPEVKSEILIDASHLDNAVLKRLIEEIKFDSNLTLNGYNRTHNRHNRGR